MGVDWRCKDCGAEGHNLRPPAICSGCGSKNIWNEHHDEETWAVEKLQPWEPTYYLRIKWTAFELKGRMSEVDAACRELLGREVSVVMPGGTRKAIGIIQGVKAERSHG